jgi:hypothetical protein
VILIIEVKLGMKQRLRLKLRKRQLFFTIVVLATVGIRQLAHGLEEPLDGRCSGLGYLASNRSTTTVQALKVVVKPWLGRHQVYGVFPLPFETCNRSEPVLLTIIGAGNYCQRGKYTQPTHHFEELQPPPGYTLVRYPLRTRTTLWLTTKGLLEQLKQPRNWTVTYNN